MGTAILLTITTLCVIYIAKFNKDFKEEDLQKLTPLMALLVVFIVLSIILGGIS